MPLLSYSRPRFNVGEAMSQNQRRTLLRQLILDHDGALVPRVTACIRLLCAQPLIHIRAITLDDIVRDEHGAIALRLGDPPSPVPEPFAPLLLQLAAQRPETASDRWLFTGRTISRPLRGVAQASP